MGSTEHTGSSQCSGTNDDFTAEVTYEDDRRRVTIDGTLSCPRPAFELTLDHGNPGINPDPKELVLRLVEKPPTGTHIEVVTETKVHGEFAIKPEVERVRIENLDVTLSLDQKRPEREAV
ncbi:hypothetical protein ACF059_30130 [Streptomyces sp. NPDC016562]|uniref:hypothetical protein n=1 Tax=Streptomyces sp. NPDC016562 TaxID=3364966 RepID=UPI0036F68E10